MTKEYSCICGKVYTNPQSFNAHKRHCEEHLISVGKLEKIRQSDKISAIKCAETWKCKISELNAQKLEKWVSEQHKCEKCGKIMTEYFGSGRFCCRACANSRKITDESRIKISQILRGRPLTELEIENLLNPKLKPKQEKYTGPTLPNIEVEKLSPGFFPRTRLSYAEKFWKQVLDNNCIDYMHDYVVQKPKGELGVFRLDFLIGNIDIEIDGGVHTKSAVKEKDFKRDEYLKSLGYIVYRIKWVNPINDKNKIVVNKQIEDLFKFLNRPRLV